MCPNYSTFYLKRTLSACEWIREYKFQIDWSVFMIEILMTKKWNAFVEFQFQKWSNFKASKLKRKNWTPNSIFCCYLLEWKTESIACALIYPNAHFSEKIELLLCINNSARDVNSLQAENRPIWCNEVYLGWCL